MSSKTLSLVLTLLISLLPLLVHDTQISRGRLEGKERGGEEQRGEEGGRRRGEGRGGERRGGEGDDYSYIVFSS